MLNNIPKYALFTCLLLSAKLYAQDTTVIHVDKISNQNISVDGNVFKHVPLGYGNTAPIISIENIKVDTISEVANSIKVGQNFSPNILLGKEKKKLTATIGLPLVVRYGTGTYLKLTGYDMKIIGNTNSPSPALQRPTGVATSVLASGTWYKFKIGNRGVYKIDYAFLQSLGLTPSTVNPNNIRIYGNGGTVLGEMVSDGQPDDLTENAIKVVASGSTFQSGDYVLFYANGPVSWAPNSANNAFNHTQNYYEDSSYYFLNVDLGTGKRIATENVTNAGSTTYTTFDDYATYDKDSVSISAMGKKWYSNYMNSVNGGSITQSINLGIPDMSLISSDIRYTAEFAAASDATSSISLKYNNTTIGTGSFSNMLSSGSHDYNYAAKESTLSGSFTPNTSVTNLSFTYVPNITAEGYFNFVEFNFSRQLSFPSHQFNFRNLGQSALTGYVSYQLANASSSITVWDVTDPLTPVQETYSLSGTNASFNSAAGSLKEFVAFNGSDYMTPSAIGKIDNQNLHGLSVPNLLIITTETFATPAQTLASYHQTKDGLSTQIVYVDKIYNEFSSGGQDIGGIRNFIKHLYDKGDNTLQSVLLLGAASYDYKDRITNNTNFVPTFETYESNSYLTGYSSDEYFMRLDSGENINDRNTGNYLDIGVGRIPAISLDEANAVVQKIINYTSSTALGNWKNQSTFVSDYYDTRFSTSFTKDGEDMSNTLGSADPQINLNKLYCDASTSETTPSGVTYPLIQNGINNNVATGTFLINYVGHGNPTKWSSAKILSTTDVTSWSNNTKLPIFVTATCDFGRYDDPANISVGAQMLTKSNGGGIAVITTTNVVYQSENKDLTVQYLNNQFTRDEDTHQWLSFGEAFRKGKIDATASQENGKRFNLLGDPALVPALPTYNVITDSIQEYLSDDNLKQTDSIKALGKYVLNGSVRSTDGAILNSFNGTATVTIYDKKYKIKCTNESYLSSSADPGFDKSYEIQDRIVFKGNATVTNGVFNLTFVAPLDLNYSYGNGKISYYAENGSEDANGVDTGIIVGGYSANSVTDNEGPIVQPFIDDDKFRDGGITGTDPVLFVKLSDDNGINISGAAIGHDLVAFLDDDLLNPYILNNYYTSAANDFTKGTVTYPMSGLSVGKHQLRVRAWDVNNNSGEGVVNFEVLDSTQGGITIYNYPNPFTDNTNIVFQHNHSNEAMDVTLTVFNSAGARMYQSTQHMEPTQNRTEFVWNGSSVEGGVYMYQVFYKTAKNIQGKAYQKMVLIR